MAIWQHRGVAGPRRRKDPLDEPLAATERRGGAVGTTDRGALVKLVETEARSGVFLSVLGFGMGNLKDGTLETLSNKGNGNYSYIDSMREARKVFTNDLAGTLVTIARQVRREFPKDHPAIPLLITQGDADPVCPVGHLREFLATVEHPNLRYEEFKDVLHEPFADDHSEDVLGTVGDWLDSAVTT